MPVPAVTSDGRMSDADLAATSEAFHDLHEELHTYAVRDEEPIVRAVRLQTTGRTPKPPPRSRACWRGSWPSSSTCERPLRTIHLRFRAPSPGAWARPYGLIGRCS